MQRQYRRLLCDDTINLHVVRETTSGNYIGCAVFISQTNNSALIVRIDKAPIKCEPRQVYFVLLVSHFSALPYREAGGCVAFNVARYNRVQCEQFRIARNLQSKPKIQFWNFNEPSQIEATLCHRTGTE